MTCFMSCGRLNISMLVTMVRCLKMSGRKKMCTTNGGSEYTMHMTK